MYDSFNNLIYCGKRIKRKRIRILKKIVVEGRKKTKSGLHKRRLIGFQNKHSEDTANEYRIEDEEPFWFWDDWIEEDAIHTRCWGPSVRNEEEDYEWHTV